MNVADVRAKVEPVLTGTVAHVKGMVEDPQKFLSRVPEDPRVRAAGAAVAGLMLVRMLRRRRR